MTDHIYSPSDLIADRYFIEKFLAAGGMQEVYVATDRILKRKVAVKTPKNDSASKRFKASAALSARISHPYVAKTYDYLESSERAHLVEELVPGCNLEEFITHTMPYPDSHLVAQCLHQLSMALRASHQVGVVHRDLKPSNIIVEQSSKGLEFKITDFGIAKLAEEELERAAKTQSTILNSSTMFGALPYMSPEIIENPKKADTPSDVWALGAIIYRLMMGQAPFGEGLGAIPKIVSGILPVHPSRLSALNQFKPLTETLWAIIQKCFSMNPTERPTAFELADMAASVCYSTFPRRIGVVKSFPATTNGSFGYISTEGSDVFFHRDSYYDSKVEIGQKVYFSAHPGSPQDRAHPIVPIKKVINT
ncbi:serine/threonine protein kinase [Methylicorpusculum oleiharenae]|uniref:serine/threonine-protein kinase n=1 Tax=Methylicorpusculum oleiharenae TaxID=1338687 RepID=UPI00135860DF|nr:serine/threonine-protein kinase [Methylicorpusculum oleiharenae]MCD2453802.1 serine/threonine protein kinase [Methylicorpusculum oleiharenae]